MASRIEELCGERINMLNMQTYYTIIDYMVHNEYIMQKDAPPPLKGEYSHE